MVSPSKMFLLFFALILIVSGRDPSEAKNLINSSDTSNVENTGLYRLVSPSSQNEHHQHLRNLQSSQFSLRRKFCVPDGNGSYETKNVFFFRAFLFRLRYESANRGPCDEEKCLNFCEHISCMVPHAFSQDTGSCNCKGDSTPVECGVNAECSEIDDECVCNEGFDGDARVGCVAINEPALTKSPSSKPTISSTFLLTKSPTPENSTLPCDPECSTEHKCCDGTCIQKDQCCTISDGKRCPDNTCANDPPNFGCCLEAQCGELCCEEGLKCCDGSCKPDECCGNPDPCCSSQNDNSSCQPPTTVFGDPHLTTFDGLAYDCQAEGEFILSKSLNSSFEVQARFKRSRQYSASFVKGLAIRSSEGHSTVQLIVSEDAESKIRLWVDGNEIIELAEGYKSKNIEFGEFRNNSLVDYYIYNADASITINVVDSSEGKFLNLNINLIAKLANERLVGLLGTPDNDPSNDWMDRAGNQIHIPNTREMLTSTPANEYCAQNWCLRNENQTLFVYDKDGEFESLSKGCDKQYEGRPTFDDPTLLDLCGKDLDCLLDGYLFGIETARSSVAAQTRYLESNKVFHVSPINLVAGVDTMINVTLDLRKKGVSNKENIESFALYLIDESSGIRLPNRIATLKRLSTSSLDIDEADSPIFVGENIDISSASFSSGSFSGLQAVADNSSNPIGNEENETAYNADRSISDRKAFRALNKFGEGKCFDDKEELEDAIKEYNENSGRDSAVARKYGWPIGVWCVKHIKDFSGLFANYEHFDETLNSWDVSQATSMRSMFEGASAFNSNISSWDVGKVKTMANMFSTARSFDIDISEWNVRNVVSMERMFYYADKFNRDLSAWQLASILSAAEMFAFAKSYEQDLCIWTEWLRDRDIRNMFMETNCPFTSSPNYNQIVPSPFCFSCDPPVQNNAELRAAVEDYLGEDNFASKTYGPSIGQWNVSLVTNFTSVFEEKTTFNENLNAWDLSKATTMHRMFYGASIFSQNVSMWDVSNVNDMSELFTFASKFQSDISGWQVNKVTDMSFMFFDAAAFQSDLSQWRVDCVASMASMFGGALLFQSDLSSWNVSKVTDMYGMFLSAHSFSSDLSKWSVSNVMNMDSMFADATIFSSDLSSWTVSNVTSMGWMFQMTAEFDSDLSAWQVDKVTDMRNMFYDAEICSSNLSKWKVDRVTNMQGMFAYARKFSSDLSAWNTSMVTNMVEMFYEASSFNSNLSSWSVSNVLSMNKMFKNAIRFEQNLCPWGLSLNSEVSVDEMFQGTNCTFTDNPDLNLAIPGPFCFSCHSHYAIKANAELRAAVDDYLGKDNFASQTYGPSIGNWNVTLVTDFTSIFEGKSTFNENLDAWDVSRATSMHRMFLNASSFSQNISFWDVSNVVDMSGMFAFASIFRSDLSTWQVDKVTDMSYMFYEAEQFTSSLSDWRVDSVKDMAGMFKGTWFFQSDLSSWNVSKVTNMNEMFCAASSFSSDLSNWTVSRVTDMETMFAESVMFSSDISTWNVSKVTSMEGMFANAENFASDLSAWDVAGVTKMAYMFYSATSFDSNLCSWGEKLSYGTNVTGMFQNSDCPHSSDPILPYPDTFCRFCGPS